MRACEMEIGTDQLFFNSEAEKHRIGGIGFIVHKSRSGIKNCVFKSHSNRIASLTFSFHNTQVGIIGCYAPTECSDDHAEKEAFYKHLHMVFNEMESPISDLIVDGNYNSGIGSDMTEKYRSVVGRHVGDVQETSENGIRLLDMCISKKMYIANTFFPNREARKNTWYYPRT